MTGKFEYVFLPTGHENVENRELYVSDGFHPVLLGDILNDGRYRIVHKLGFGGFGTVWLARDSREAHYVSIKILTAFNSGDSRELHIQKYLRAQNGDYPGRQFISTLVDDFTLKGPNGHHLCLVYEALGPSIVSLRSEYGEAYLKIRPDIARQLAKQVGEALDFLHRSGLTYGDLSASNTLLELSAIHDLSEEDIYHHFGTPVEDEMQLCDSDAPLPSSAPRMVYAPLEWSNVPLQYLMPRIKLIDFGSTFLSGDPSCNSDVGFNNSYAAPEVLGGARPTSASDIWALACVIFEIRSGTQLFSQGYFGGKDAALHDIKAALGLLPTPESDMQTLDLARSQQDESGSGPEEIPCESHCAREASLLRRTFDLGWAPLRWLQERSRKRANSKTAQETSVHVPQPDCDIAVEDRAMRFSPSTDSALSDRSLRQRILEIAKLEAWQMNGPEEGSFPEPLSSEEVADLEDLLASMLKYDARERMTLDQISAHPWFSKDYATDVKGDWLQRWS